MSDELAKELHASLLKNPYLTLRLNNHSYQLSNNEALIKQIEASLQPIIADTKPPSVTPTTTPTAPAEPVGYNGLPWKQSEKRRELATILVTPELPLPAKELYDALSKSANLTLKLNDATYRLSKTDTGSEFLQRWTKASK